MDAIKRTEQEQEEEEDTRLIKSEIRNGWWMEMIDISCPGQAFCLKVKEILYHEKSIYQDILIFKSESYGNVLVLDGIVNCTEKDEMSYQEMMTHLALYSHPNPKSVLIIGGGDGGVAREVAKHSCVEEIVQCEIDDKVVAACRKYLPSMAKGFDNERVYLHIGDGFEYMRRHQNRFDVIITDSSDPIGPAEKLFEKEYYELIQSALKPDGILSSQGEAMWVKMAADYIRPLVKGMKELFPIVRYAYTHVPSYTTGQIGVLLASKNPNTTLETPVRRPTSEEMDNLRYYNYKCHQAAFKLPQFIKNMFE